MTQGKNYCICSNIVMGRIYGIPSGTLSSLMDALAEDKDIRFLTEVRHNGCSCFDHLAAQVAVGSGGPGALRLTRCLRCSYG